MPGFSGFPAELSILVGTWRVRPLWTLAAALGIVFACAFTLRAIQVSFFGSTRATSDTHADHGHDAHPLPPITWPEKAGAALLLAATLYVGLKPDAVLAWIVPALQSPAFTAILKGGAQ